MFRLAARANEWPYPFPPMETTYAQSILMMKAQLSPEEEARPLPDRMWKDLVAIRTGGIPSWA